MSVRLTEQPSLYDHLETKSVAELLRDINNEDKKVALAIEAVLPDIERLVNAIEKRRFPFDGFHKKHPYQYVSLNKTHR